MVFNENGASRKLYKKNMKKTDFLYLNLNILKHAPIKSNVDL